MKPSVLMNGHAFVGSALVNMIGPDIAISEQRSSWERWNAAAREHKIGPIPTRHADVIASFIARLGRHDLNLIDVGCGTGWMCKRLSRYGQVTGTDMVEEALARARQRLPDVRFVAGDFFELGLPRASFDVAVSLEVLSHVADQQAFVARIASLLKPNGYLILVTQNRPILERWSAISPPMDGQIRRWVNAKELKQLMASQCEDVRILSVYPVGDRGWLRLLNSCKLNRLLSLVVPRRMIERLKERAMLGHSLIAIGRLKGQLEVEPDQ